MYIYMNITYIYIYDCNIDVLVIYVNICILLEYTCQLSTDLPAILEVATCETSSQR